jgi:aminopeptidase N
VVIIAHEMSHMWFGNLVTMRWWGDLWLNEGFADYMGHRVPTQVTRYANALTTWSAGRKGQGLLADQRPSTHAVSATEVTTAQEGLLNLDRISYYKGSSILRQLATRIGEEAFQAGLRHYFQQYEYGNTSYAEFLGALGGAVGQDLTEWATMWLREANLNTLSLEVEVADGRIISAAILQTAPDSHPILREHTLDIGLYGGQDAVVRVDVKGARTELPALTGRPAPKFILLNQGDLAYAKVRFDAASWRALPEVLPALSDVDRAMIWGQLLLGVFDGVVSGADYLDLAAKALPAEPISQIIAEVLSKARVEVADRYLQPEQRDAALVALAQACRQLLSNPGNSQDRQLTVFRSLIEFTTDLAELRAWLGGAQLPARVALDAELSWRILYRLTVLGDASEDEIAQAYEADRTTQGETYQAKCRAALPTREAKQAAWDAIMGDTTLSNHHIFALGEGFWQPEQSELTQPYVERFFAETPAAGALRGDQVLEMLIRFLYPRYAVSVRTLQLAEQLLGREDVPLPLRRKVIDLTDDLRRAVRVRAADNV